jgi:cold shock CspA family protein
MKLPLEITYRDVPKTQAIDNLVREKAGKLEQVCNYINSCRVVIEKIHDRPSSGSPYRVRLDITVPPSHELVADQNPGEGNQYDAVETVIRSAFDAARRQLIELVERQRNEVKKHPQQAMVAVVTKLFPEQAYGFIKTLDTGREIYFHKNSVTNHDFDRLKIGTGVQFAETLGQMGPQATTVHIVSKPAVQSAETQEPEIEPPAGWN